ncbi:MAG: T9SS type A sorting domain-containing protein [Flavobacteriales bacterium]|nr:T9SS type A sorting domain-containing protein [Flavobacteriales bacterium]
MFLRRPWTVLFSSVLHCATYAQFGPQIDISLTASAPSGIIVADLDGDGMNDVLTAAYSDNKVAWYANTGAGTFGVQQVLSADLLNATDCEAADLDGDGDLDVVASGWGANKVVWFRNEGLGYFSPERVVSASAMGAWAVDAADVNGDGLVDLLAACGESDRISLYLNLGEGQFTQEQVISTLTANAMDVSTADLDGDGDEDVISCSAEDDKVAWYMNDGSGNFGPQTIVSTAGGWPLSAVGADIDNDLDLDLLTVTSEDEALAWFPNQGDGTFGTRQVITSSSDIEYLRATFASDLDNDGDLDLLTATGIQDLIAWYENSGSGVFGAQQVISSAADNAGFVIAGDLDGDGDQDVISAAVGDDRTVYYSNNGTGLFGAPYVIAASNASNARVALTAPIDTDGIVDVISMSNADGRIAWYPGDGVGGIGAQVLIGIVPDPNSMLPVDLDSDGDTDILVTSFGGFELSAFFNDGTGGFGARENLADQSLLYDVAAGDVDGDGDPDLLLAVADDDGMKVLFNDGSGHFPPSPTDFPSTTTLASPMLVDVDEDGDLDAVYAYDFSGGLVMRLNDGSGQFAPEAPIGTLGSSVNRLRWADIDGDGVPDLIASADGDDRIVWYPNLGNGAFGAQQVVAILNGPRGLDVADFDGDFDKDITATSWFDGLVVYYLNDGTGQFSEQHLISNAPYAPIWLCADDLDGDGDPDVMIASNLDDRIAWYENYFGAKYIMQGELFHDVNEDGVHDAGEPPATWIGVRSVPFMTMPFSDPDGSYRIMADMGSYEVMPVIDDARWGLSTTPAVYDVTLDDVTPIVGDLDFGFKALVDTSVIVPSFISGTGICGAMVPQWISFTNHGTRIEHGVLTLQLDTLFTFNSAEPAPDVIEDHLLTWNFDALTYEEVRTIALWVTLPSADHIGDTLNAELSVMRMDELDQVTDTFSEAWMRVVACSYDPNDKAVLPGGTGAQGVVDIATDHFDYTIRFQNTGTAPAESVMLRDLIDSELDPSSFEILAYSHEPTSILIEPDGELVIRFNGIQLPDSGADLLGSQGSVRFRLKVAEGATHGTVVANTARIHFDLNAPVITNTVVNTLIDCSLHTAEITLVGDEVLEASVGEAYQWLLAGEEVEGATASSFMPTVEGEYAVKVTSEYGCVATSEPYHWIPAGLEEPHGLRCAVIPNPFTDQVQILFSTVLTPDHWIELVDLNGRVLRSIRGAGSDRVILDRAALPTGLYTLRISQNGVPVETQRLVAE